MKTRVSKRLNESIHMEVKTRDRSKYLDDQNQYNYGTEYFDTRFPV